MLPIALPAIAKHMAIRWSLYVSISAALCSRGLPFIVRNVLPSCTVAPIFFSSVVSALRRSHSLTRRFARPVSLEVPLANAHSIATVMAASGSWFRSTSPSAFKFLGPLTDTEFFDLFIVQPIFCRMCRNCMSA